MKFFSTDSKLFQFITRLWDIIVLNFCWLIIGGAPAIAGVVAAQLSGVKAFYALCLISVITYGPATISAFTILLKMVDDAEGYIVRPFLRGFRENLKQGIPMGAFAILVVAAAYTELYVLSHQMNLIAFFILGVFTTVLGVVIIPYSFPLAARYENRVVNHLRNALRISMKYFGRSILLWIVLAIELVIFLWNTYTQLVGALIGPMTLMLTISGFALPIFRKIEADGGAIVKKTEEDRYNEEIEREVEAALQKEHLK